MKVESSCISKRQSRAMICFVTFKSYQWTIRVIITLDSQFSTLNLFCWLNRVNRILFYFFRQTNLFGLGLAYWCFTPCCTAFKNRRRNRAYFCTGWKSSKVWLREERSPKYKIRYFIKNKRRRCCWKISGTKHYKFKFKAGSYSKSTQKEKLWQSYFISQGRSKLWFQE